MPEIYNCSKCEKKKVKHASKLKAKKATKFPIKLLEHSKPVAPLDLLLSVAEGRIHEAKQLFPNCDPHDKSRSKPRASGNSTTVPTPSKKPKTLEGLARRAIIQNGYVYLSNSVRAEDGLVRMRHQQRNLFSSLYADFSVQTSRHGSLC